MSEDKCVMCGTVIPEGRQVCPKCAGEFDEPITLEFVCGILAELLDHPCNFSPPEEEMHSSEENCEWCEEHCGKATTADCWMRYFQLRYSKHNP